MPAPKTPAHIAYIDIFRGLACVYVVIHHCIFSLFDPAEVHGAWLTAFLRVFSNANIALVIFIVISGFCLGIPVARAAGDMPETYGRFLMRRAARILPPYWVALALGALMGLTVISTQVGTFREWDNSVPFDSTAVWLHVALLEDVLKTYTDKVDHPLWSVAVEFHIYLLFPLLVMLTRRWRTLRATLAVMLGAAGIWGLLYALRATVWPDINIGPSGISPHFLVLFFFGFLLAKHAHRIQAGDRRIVAGLTVMWLVVSALCTWAAMHLPAQTEGVGRYMLRDLAKAGAVCILLMALIRINRDGLVDRWRWGRVVAYFGTMSYSIYLVHGPVIEWVMRLEGAYQGTVAFKLLIGVLVAPAVAVVVGMLFYALVERPSHRWAGRLRAPRPTLAAAEAA